MDKILVTQLWGGGQFWPRIYEKIGQKLNYFPISVKSSNLRVLAVFLLFIYQLPYLYSTSHTERNTDKFAS